MKGMFYGGRAGAVEPEALAAAVGTGIIAGGTAIRTALAASAGAGRVVFGKDEEGGFEEMPVLALGAPSVYDALFGPFSSPEALRLWETGVATITPEGDPLVAIVEMPGPSEAQLNLPANRLLPVGADFGLAVEASSDGMVRDSAGQLEMLVMIESVGDARVAMGLAADAPGRLPISWVNEPPADLPYGTRAMARLLVQPGAGGRALVEVTPLGAMPVIPVTTLFSAATSASATPAGLSGLDVPLDEDDGVIAVWSRGTGTTMGSADATFAAVGWENLSDPAAMTPGSSYAIVPCWSQGRAAGGALGSTGTIANGTRCVAAAFRGGARMTRQFFAGAHTSDGACQLPTVADNRPGDILIGYTFRRGAEGNGAMPEGATLLAQVNASSSNIRLFRIDNLPETYAPSPIAGADGASLASSFLVRLRPAVNSHVRKTYPNFAALDAVSDVSFAPGSVIETEDGHRYEVAAAGEHITTAGGVKLKLLDPVITSEAFGGDPTGVADSTAAFNRAMQVAVATKRPGRSSGTYKMTGTLSPGGRYAWDWSVTHLNWSGAAGSAHNISGYTELGYIPSGYDTPQPSGKRVLFDTMGCGDSVNSGDLQITGEGRGNMRLASRAAINANIVAISASVGNSADMIWEKLTLLGCGHALWQGDQRGGGQNMLPYTRWVMYLLKIQFCLQPLESGASGNGFDDMFIANLRLTRNVGTSILRGTDLSGGTAFLNGLGPSTSQDLEAQTLSVTAGSTTATLSADNALVVVGTTLAIIGAGTNKAGEPIDFVCRVTAKSGTTLTFDKPAEVTVAAATFAGNPPQLTLSSSSWHFLRTYLEELWYLPMLLSGGNSAVYGSIKISGGDLSSYYDTGIVLIDNAMAFISLHDRSANNGVSKAVVGVASLRNGAVYNSASARVQSPMTRAAGTVRSDPIRIIPLRAQDIPGDYINDASGDYNSNLTLIVDYLDGVVRYQQHGAGVPKVAFKEPQELGTPRLISEASPLGTFSDAGGGVYSKVSGGVGALTLPVTPGKTYRVSVTVSAATSMAALLRWYLGTTPGANEAFIARTNPGRYVAYVTVPAGVDRLGLSGSTNEAFSVTEFSVAEVLW